MEILFLLFSAGVGVAAALASIAIWAPRRTAVRATAVVLTGILIPLIYVGLTEIMSRPKPIDHEWFKGHVDEATVLGVSIEEGRAIYLWLRLDRSLEPRYYVLPWRRQLAETLQSFIDEAIRDRAAVKMKNPFSGKAYENLGELNLRVVPRASPPLKPPPPPAQFYNPRTREI